jgi:hypothetical protein
MIPMLFFVALFLVVVSRPAVPSLAGIADSAGDVWPNVMFHLALAGLLTALLLVVRSIVSDRHPDSR